MKVLLDARMLLGRFSGVGRVVTALAEHLASRGDVRVAVLCGNEPYEPWRERHDIDMLVSDFSRAQRTPLRRLIWESTQAARWMERSGADVYHALWNSGVPGNCPIPAVLTIHDLIPPSYSGFPGIRAVFETRIQRLAVARSAAHAALLTTVSEYSRQCVLADLRVAQAKVTVVYNGVELHSAALPPVDFTSHHPHSTVASREPETPLYFLYVGGYEARKNLDGLFTAVGHYWRSHGAAVQLWLTGHRERLPVSAADALRRAERCGTVRFLGDVSDHALRGLYQRAAALLIVSLHEGFGLPALEAMACGCPVIAANRTSLPEIVGDAGALVDPLDAAAISSTIDRVLRDRVLRETMIRHGRARAERFSWSAATERYLELYAAAIAGRAAQRHCGADQLAEKNLASVPSGPIGSTI